MNKEYGLPQLLKTKEIHRNTKLRFHIILPVYKVVDSQIDEIRIKAECDAILTKQEELLYEEVTSSLIEMIHGLHIGLSKNYEILLRKEIKVNLEKELRELDIIDTELPLDKETLVITSLIRPEEVFIDSNTKIKTLEIKPHSLKNIKKCILTNLNALTLVKIGNHSCLNASVFKISNCSNLESISISSSTFIPAKENNNNNSVSEAICEISQCSKLKEIMIGFQSFIYYSSLIITGRLVGDDW